MTLRLILAVAVMAAVTFMTRAAPFLFFRRRKPPEFLRYIQRYAPAVVMSLLVLSSFKDIEFSVAPYGTPALAGALLTAGLHAWKRNTLLSIAAGTAVYMVLIRLA